MRRKTKIITEDNVTFKQGFIILREYIRIRQADSEDDYLFCTVYNNKMDRRTVNGSLSTYNRKRNVNKLGVHRLRHTAAKKCILAGKLPSILQHLLGHSSLVIAQNYINILVSDLKKEVDNFNYIYGGLGLVIGVLVPVPYRKVVSLLSVVKKNLGDAYYNEAKLFVVSLASLHPEDFAEDKVVDLLDKLDNKFGDHLSRNTIKEIVDFVVKTVIADVAKEVVK